MTNKIKKPTDPGPIIPLAPPNKQAEVVAKKQMLINFANANPGQVGLPALAAIVQELVRRLVPRDNPGD